MTTEQYVTLVFFGAICSVGAAIGFGLGLLLGWHLTDRSWSSYVHRQSSLKNGSRRDE